MKADFSAEGGQLDTAAFTRVVLQHIVAADDEAADAAAASSGGSGSGGGESDPDATPLFLGIVGGTGEERAGEM